MKIFGIFSDANQEFSWRKCMTAGCLLVFLLSQIGFLVSHGFKDELPTAYWAVDGSVFAFYFLKNTLSNVKISTPDNTTKP